MKIKGPIIYAEGKNVIANGAITIDHGIIESIASSDNTKADIVLPVNYHIIPGLIDLHIHGHGGFDTMDGTCEALQSFAKILPQFGVTSFLATTMTDSSANIEHSMIAACKYQKKSFEQNANLLGIHLEGPFISIQALGSQKREFVKKPDISLFEHWNKLSGNQIKIVTIAPECDENYQLIRHLKAKNIIASIGHTIATYEETDKAINAGCTHATHLFNAMRCFNHRDPGCVAALLQRDEIIVELIADGIHLAPGTIKLVERIKRPDRYILISDGLNITGLKPGTYSSYHQTITVDQKSARLQNGTLAGSLLTLDQALRNMITFTSCSFQDALIAVTETPAKHLNLFNRIGSIKKGKDADIVILNENFEVVMSFCKGKLVYSNIN